MPAKEAITERSHRDAPSGSGEEGFVSLVSNGRQRAAFGVDTKNMGIFRRKCFFLKMVFVVLFFL